jgi:hypothetical protein
MWCRSGGLALGGVGVLARDVARFPAAGHYRLVGGRVEDALRAPLRGRASPGP